MFKTVLFPIDHSRESQDAADTVLNIVKTYGSKLVLLSVVESPSEDAPQTTMSSPEAIAELLQQTKLLFQKQNIDAEILEREGKPAFIICDVADEVEADLIIMGCRGLGLTEEGASESVTSRVINLSPCPVLIVP